MHNHDQITIQELEFDKIRLELAKYCKSEKAKEKAAKIKPFTELSIVESEFSVLKEIQLIYEDKELSLPQADPANIDHALKVLAIENGVLTVDEVVKVLKLCWSTREMVQFAKRNQDKFPNLFENCKHIDRFQNVIKLISNVLDKNLKISDSATVELKKIRTKKNRLLDDIQKNFNSTLSNYRKAGLLHETLETFIDQRRLLVIPSTNKGKVSGRIRGGSAKGNLSYVEPSQNIELNELLEKTLIDESNEVYLILQDLSSHLRDERKNLEAFERLLVRYDLYHGKVRLAHQYGGVIPKLSNKQILFWRAAKHPLLLLKMGADQVVGQEIELHAQQRILVVSGPNAGGKSITLKTVGLLQLMFQSGLLVPTHVDSEFGWFGSIYSDIGDHQSIENQLSTYSAKLERMRLFLEGVNYQSLVLLDEFGSGSDPELGGALAEVFFEELYNSGCTAVINTHYANIKVITANLPEAINGSMLFDTDKLEPKYKLSIGQPGSSFTFEVAKMRKISSELIDRAKEKVSANKLLLDDLTLKLQSEQSDLSKAQKLHRQAHREAEVLKGTFEQKLQELYEKAQQQHKYFEQQGKYQRLGKKIFELIKKYQQEENNKNLNQEVKKLVAIEKKRVIDKKDTLNKITAPKIEKPKKVGSSHKKNPKVASTKPVKIGQLVKIHGYDKAGTLKSIDGKKVVVQLGRLEIQSTIEKIIAI
jgi:DNA mismatch repair protein MutS2